MNPGYSMALTDAEHPGSAMVPEYLSSAMVPGYSVALICVEYPAFATVPGLPDYPTFPVVLEYSPTRTVLNVSHPDPP